MSEERNTGLTEGQVMEIMHRELVPVFQKLVGDHKHTHGRLEALENEHKETKRMTNGVHDGIMAYGKNRRRSSLSESINLDDLGDARDIYKAHNGTDMKDDLIDHILENDIPDEHLEGILSNLRANSNQRYGGFQKRADTAPASGSGDLKESPSEGTSDLKDTKAPEGKKKASDDWYEKVMSQHKSMRGNKL